MTFPPLEHQLHPPFFRELSARRPNLSYRSAKMAAPLPHKHQDALDRALEGSDAEAISIYRAILASPFEPDEDAKGKEIAITRLAEALAKKRFVVDGHVCFADVVALGCPCLQRRRGAGCIVDRDEASV